MAWCLATEDSLRERDQEVAEEQVPAAREPSASTPPSGMTTVVDTEFVARTTPREPAPPPGPVTA
ncbi:hypothetical protein PUR34_37770 [Streptomyces sp. JV185]|uniref:hypothetical protein n=1 Tax=Streptomyces sp. JV185 TaxID=858638 RepID=UPI002E75AC25|nr:hypothetical protein [Streptomyces sp. JV185]MEE1773770.1 hypothetical protein [Streptomyces sp. JV185]